DAGGRARPARPRVAGKREGAGRRVHCARHPRPTGRRDHARRRPQAVPRGAGLRQLPGVGLRPGDPVRLLRAGPFPLRTGAPRAPPRAAPPQRGRGGHHPGHLRRGSVAWIEMELVDGPDLKRELSLRDRPFAVPEALSVGAAVAHALAAAHEAGVFHRDVKPANVLLPRSRRPMAKLGDFGTSRLAGAARITHTGLLAGTPQFVAPEVVAGGSAGPAADVYGLMLCVYLMLSGNRFPFERAED